MSIFLTFNLSVGFNMNSTRVFGFRVISLLDMHVYRFIWFGVIVRKHRINVPFISIGVVVLGLCNASSE